MDKISKSVTEASPALKRGPVSSDYAASVKQSLRLDLAREPACPICHDYEFAPGEDGVYRPCVCRAARRAAEKARKLEAICRLPDDAKGNLFSGYWVDKHGTEAINAARALLARGWGWLMLEGSCGTGKTFLLTAIVNEARTIKKTAVYLTMAELLVELRRAFDPKAEVQFSELADLVKDCDVLCLDEVDRFNTTPWAKEQFFALIEWRYRNVRRSISAFATNNYDRLPEYFQDRIEDGRFAVVTCAGESVRRGLREESQTDGGTG